MKPESKGSFDAKNDEERIEIMVEYLHEGLFKENFKDELVKKYCIDSHDIFGESGSENPYLLIGDDSGEGEFIFEG